DMQTAELCAGALLHEGRFDEASAVLDKARRVAPEDVPLQLLTGRLARARGEFDKAATIFEAVAKRYPNRPLVLEMLAESYLFDFRVEQERAVLRKLVPLEKERLGPYSLSLLGSYIALGEWESALEQIDALIKRAPGTE